MKKILVILGPTAVGKSDLAVKIARKISNDYKNQKDEKTRLDSFSGAEIISADSRQVYKGLNIGTGKITRKEMQGIKHRLIDVANPKKRFDVEKYKNLAKKAIENITSKNKLPIVVGGTGFYIQALIDGIIFSDVQPNNELRETLSKKSDEELMEILKGLDLRRAKDIDPKNSRRIIRAIEIAVTLGKVPKLKSIPNRFDTLFIGLTLPPKELRKKIKDRLIKRMKKGMLSEAKKLHEKNGLSWKRMNELGLEYRYLALYLQNKIDKKEMLEKLETEIWHYAKRQITWFKKDKRIKWFEPKDIEKINKEIENFLS
ncbi:MAG TPA: tRNA (adenosine(37)-N6)-dimethylallyltransferase MiaA [Candidatus Paceibacterota bacterium]